MNYQHTVSVVVATYNGERFIAEQLRSLIFQTHRPLEIIISDDGSSDGTQRIVADFAAASDVPIRLRINRENLGYSDNFLAAAALAEGDLLAFCDQDDIWLPNKLEEGAKPFADDSVQLSVHTADLIDDSGVNVGYLAQGINRSGPIPPSDFEPWGVFMGFSMLFRRSLLDLMPADQRGKEPFNPSMPLSHDRWIYFLATSAGGVFGIQKPLVKYRQHTSNVFGSRGGVWGARRYASILTLSLGDARERGSAHLEIARNRLSLLQGALAEQSENSPLFHALTVARERWKRFCFVTGQRQGMYELSQKSERFRKWISNVAGGVYSEKSGPFMRIVLAARDLIVAFK